jgi:hypothetical protein
MPIIVAIDTETTGLGHRLEPPQDDAIIQVGIAWRDTSGKLSTWGSLCLPDKKYFANGRADRALEVNKLGINDILKAKTDIIVARDLRVKLTEIKTKHRKEVELRAYNLKFDEPFLRKKPWNIPTSIWGPCIMRSTSNYFRLGMANLKLADALDKLGIKKPKGNLHNAETDATAALLINERLNEH